MGYQKSTWKLSARGSVYLENKKCTVESASLSAVSLAPASMAFIDSYNNDVIVVSFFFAGINPVPTQLIKATYSSGKVTLKKAF